MHSLHFNIEGQETQPTPFVALHVCSTKQQPGDPTGLINLLVLQTAHIDGVSHLVQFKVDGQGTQFDPRVKLQVNYAKQHPIEAATLG